jgi:polyphosphate kinase
VSDQPVDLNHPSLYLNREISLLEFQRRVLEEAWDERNPLLERVKFLSIFGSNMDEFFMVRVFGIRKLVESQIVSVSPDGMTPQDELAAIHKLSQDLYDDASRCLHKKIMPALEKARIHILEYAKLTPAQKVRVDAYFNEVIYPVLTPLAFDPGHPFPHISNLSLNLAILIRDKKGNQRFARIKVPDTLPRLIPVKRSSGNVRKDGSLPYHHYFVWLEQVIIANLAGLFPGMEVVEVHPFRVIRDADVIIQELEAADLLETMQQSIRARRFGSVVHVSILSSMPEHVREVLIENLGLSPTDLFEVEHPLGLSSLWGLYNNILRYDLKYPPYTPLIPRPFRNLSLAGEMFDTIRSGNLLLHHPYDSYTPVTDFLNAAARDPSVLAIKQTLYRVGTNAPVVEALLEACERGKQVAVLVELKARFDEESNIEWARTLENAGVHVVYGLLGLKTHSKIALVVRQEGDNIHRYVHLATGNYNAITSQIYEDIGMFTDDEAIGADASDLFNYLTGYSSKDDYRKLLVAPINLRAGIERRIRREIKHARDGKEARLIFKVNALVDIPMVRLLYEASQAGVKVDLLVRGMCCLRPDVKGVSENIQVRSVVGRYLEHSRIYYFQNGGGEEIYLGSADLMPRNIDHRVEVLYPVENKHHIRTLRDKILETYLKDNLRTRLMQPDGTYKRITPGSDKPVDIQSWLMDLRNK